ncbi:hypothetical protein MHU86_9665 (mitochondrion) [Fragilaria crotonensis]|nr:hypothetical protein MHU86_9665 [Fragilaria crotonensis]
MKNFRRTFFCKLHLKLCYFYLIQLRFTVFSSKPFQLGSLETKKCTQFVRFCCFL